MKRHSSVEFKNFDYTISSMRRTGALCLSQGITFFADRFANHRFDHNCDRRP